MTSVLTRLLNLALLATLALAGARLGSFLREPPPALQDSPAVQAQPQPPASESAGPESPEETKIRPEAYEVIVARDLFSPTRGVVAPAPVAAAPAQRPQPAPKLTLYGVVIVDGEKSAFLVEGTQDARPRKVRENERFAGGTVSAIRPDGVTFVFAGTETIIPLRTPKEGVAAPYAAPPANAAQLPVRAPLPQQRRLVQPGGAPTAIPAPHSRTTAVNPGARFPTAVAPPDDPGNEEFFQDSPFGEEEILDELEGETPE